MKQRVNQYHTKISNQSKLLVDIDLTLSNVGRMARSRGGEQGSGPSNGKSQGSIGFRKNTGMEPRQEAFGPHFEGFVHYSVKNHALMQRGL